MEFFDICLSDRDRLLQFIRHKCLGLGIFILGHQKLIHLNLVKLPGTMAQSRVAILTDVIQNVCDCAFKKSCIESRPL